MPDSILRRVAEGDRAAVRECISRHGGLVWSLARRSCGASGDAEDAVQEIFIDLWANAARFDPSVASETTFVAMIARRNLVDRRRKEARRPRLNDLPEALVGDSPGPPERLDALDETDRAVRALESLGSDQRTVLTLSIFDGLTYDEIARKTDLPLGTVKTHARRGLINLRRELGAPGAPALTSKGGDDR